MKVVDWERKIIDFTEQFPGSTAEEIRDGIEFKQSKSTLNFTQLLMSLAFHHVIFAKYTDDVLYNPNKPYARKDTFPLKFFLPDVLN